MSTITFYLGPMGCGKTLRLFEKIFIYESAQKRILVVKWNKDQRSGLILETHSGLTYSNVHSFELLIDILSKHNLEELDGVFIDEGHFFKDLTEFLALCIQNHQHLKIFIASLYSNFKGEPFANVGKALCLASEIHFQKACCQLCKSFEGSMNTKITSSKTEIEVGGFETYKTVCPSCFFNTK
jgi:thymidine kinase